MIINIQATGVDMTDAIKQYVEEKINSLDKYFEGIQQANVDVGVKSEHHNNGKKYYAEVNLVIPGNLLRVSKNAEDLYKAIDKVKDHFKIELEKRKGKMRSKDRGALRDNKGYKG